jgi:cytochrome c peroxidase
MFKKPGLVAIAMRAPYGHNAFAKTLERVVAHYAAGGAYLDAQTKKPVRDPKTDERVKAIKMNALEQKQLLVFLIEAFVAYDMPRKEDIVPRTLP